MYDQYFMMEDYLKSNAKLEVAANVMVGGIMESLFISTAQLLEVEDDKRSNKYIVWAEASY